ncbi:Alpha-beta hydrolase superfamily lysophospholipase [Paraburkholderia tropica]|uniref:alpha/beta fold hydrolase n=1 Tax=Paraburkholderia tropica TaxID=92647 RepID=UPI001CAC9B2A|nr:alpha/beta hydrolase [Paraburkholderia tropica]CAG9227676.1 Alpha-beta hydrolase superfamily lysophospholipase [Paraburkholderia tropica]
MSANLNPSSSSAASAPWVLLRGLTRESRHWGAFAPLLEARGGAVLPVDLPGNGTRHHAVSPLDVNDYVDAVRHELQRALVLREGAPPVRVLAMSLGGMVATAWALRFPAEIARLVLVNTSMQPFSRFDERLRPAAWPALLHAAQHWRGRDRIGVAETRIHAATCARRNTLAADLDTWRAIRASAPVSRANALRQLWAAARFSARGVPRCEVLVASSRADQLVNPVCSARLAQAWGARHVEHPWAGHDLPHDDPHWLIEAICAIEAVNESVTESASELASDPASDSVSDSASASAEAEPQADSPALAPDEPASPP